MTDNTKMPFTDAQYDELSSILVTIYKSELPVELFDAFLGEYESSGNIHSALAFAFREWDC